MMINTKKYHLQMSTQKSMFSPYRSIAACTSNACSRRCECVGVRIFRRKTKKQAKCRCHGRCSVSLQLYIHLTQGVRGPLSNSDYRSRAPPSNSDCRSGPSVKFWPPRAAVKFCGPPGPLLSPPGDKPASCTTSRQDTIDESRYRKSEKVKHFISRYRVPYGCCVLAVICTRGEGQGASGPCVIFDLGFSA